MNLKYIRLYAYFSNNLGDDLMVDTLLKRFPKVTFFSENETNPREGNQFVKNRNFLNLNKFYHRWGRFNHLFNIISFYKKPDWFYSWVLRCIHNHIVCSVYIGGSIYMQHTGTSPDREKKKLQNGPLFVIGANFGPYSDPSFLDGFHDYFKLCYDVCFRDLDSYNLFSDIEHVRYAPDVVLSSNLKPVGSSKKRVLISVINCSSRETLEQYSDTYFDFVWAVCTEAINRGMEPVLTSFCEYEGDEKAIEKILQRMDSSTREKTDVFNYHDLGDFEKLIKDVGFVIATRFHAMIIALKCEIPFFCIAYSDKVKNVLSDIGCDAYFDLSEIKNCSAERVFDYSIPFNLNKSYIKNSEAQFEGLEKFLRYEK